MENLKCSMLENNITKVKTFDQNRWLRENLSYRKDTGSWAWILHRISGIALISYLLLHIWSLSSLSQGKAAFEHKMALYSGTLFSILEWLLFAFVLFHAFNGIRIVIVDWADGARYHKQLYSYSWAIGLILFIAMGAIMFSHL